MARERSERQDRAGAPLQRLSVLLGLWRFARPYRLRVAGALAALTVAAGTLLSLGIGLRQLVDQGFAAGDPALLDRAVALLFLVILVLALASYSRFYLVSWLGERVVADLRREVFNHALTLSPAYYETARTGDIETRLTADAALLEVVVGSSFSIALRNLLLLIGGLALLIVTSPKLTGLVLLMVPLVVLPIVAFGRKVRRLSRQAQERLADIAAYVEESLGAIRTLLAFNHEPYDRLRFAREVEAAFAAARKRIAARAFLTALVILLAFGAVATILWIGGLDVIAGRISPGELSAFVFYAIVVAGAAGALSEVTGDLQRAAGAGERLFELLATRSEITAPAAPLPLPDPPLGEVRLERVSFHYPARPDLPALSEIDIKVAAGERVALVGPSGAGKSTIFQLLLRFYDPQEGRILLDGLPIERVDPEALRRRFALVPQEPVIFSADAWENIRYGRPEAGDAEVLAAAESAHCRDFLEELPQGLATYLGSRGVRLSGGQRQRIAIARAILKDPAVLLLDEATSALDAESERLVQQALDRLMQQRTTLVIAHRLATVQKADRILVMDRGRIVARGTHRALLAEPEGLYARLAALQFGEGLSAPSA